LYQVEGVAEVGLGLAGEADDDVGGEGEPGDGGARAAQDPEVAAAAVAAAHEPQDPVGAGLQREVDVLAQGPAGGHGPEQVPAGVPGVGGGPARAVPEELTFWPSRLTPSTPASAGAWTSAPTSPTRRLRSLPRRLG